METNIPDRWLEISMKDGSTYKVEAGYLEQLEEVHQWYTNQPPREGYRFAEDRVINIPLLCGTTLTVGVSHITYFMMSGKDVADSIWEFNREIREMRRRIDPEGD